MYSFVGLLLMCLFKYYFMCYFIYSFMCRPVKQGFKDPSGPLFNFFLLIYSFVGILLKYSFNCPFMCLLQKAY